MLCEAGLLAGNCRCLRDSSVYRSGGESYGGLQVRPASPVEPQPSPARLLEEVASLVLLISLHETEASMCFRAEFLQLSIASSITNIEAVH